MALLTKEEAQTLLKKVLSYSTAQECEVSLSGVEGGNIRYAKNAVSTAGDTSTMVLSIRSVYGKKSGVATINEFDDASLKKVVKRAEELAQLAPENPEYMPMRGPIEYKESTTYVPATAAIQPETRAEAVAKSIQVSKDNKLESAGYIENNTAFTAVMNSKGFFAYNKSTNVVFSITSRNQEGTGSGYASRGFNDIAKLDTTAATKVAARKANSSANAKAIEPGKYTVILEPTAAVDLLGNLFRGFDARTADEGRSFMSKPGGGNRIGEQLMDEKVTIYSDPFNLELPDNTWTSEGFPLGRVNWVEKGVIKNLSYSQYWAQKKNVVAGPFASNLIMEGGTASLEDLIKGTERGILVTRLFYIRTVDPQTLLLTGLTRDGTFYIENGQIKYPIKNLRFNESPVIMLNNVDALGKPERCVIGGTGGALIPPMRIRDFTFSSLSDAV